MSYVSNESYKKYLIICHKYIKTENLNYKKEKY